MCKIFIVAGVKPSTVNKVWKFAEAIAKPMSRSNTDGLGYGAITSDGALFGERWLNNDHAFKSAGDVESVDPNYAGAVEFKSETFNYTSYGEIDKKNIVALTMHTRWATTPKGMNNVHPFVLEEVSLIHNGVIRNHHEFKLESTCDSEAILQSYVKQKVWETPTNFQAAADMIRGYYACGVLFHSVDGPRLDIFKASHAVLYVAYIKELETYVHCTSDDDIKNVCKELGYSHGPVYTILSNKFIRIDAAAGKTMSITTFSPAAEYSYMESTRHNGFPNHPTQSSTSKTSGRGGDTKQIVGAVDKTNILPYSKKRENFKMSSELLEYYNSRPMSCVALSEREIQEEIMNSERNYNR